MVHAHLGNAYHFAVVSINTHKIGVFSVQSFSIKVKISL